MLYIYSHYLMKLHEFFFFLQAHAGILLRLPVERGGVINLPRSAFLGFFSVSKVGLLLMGVTAVHSCLSHDF